MAGPHLGEIPEVGHACRILVKLPGNLDADCPSCGLRSCCDDVELPRLVSPPLDVSRRLLVVSCDDGELIEQPSRWQRFDLERHGALRGFPRVLEAAEATIGMRKIRVGISVRRIPLHRLTPCLHAALEVSK